VLDAASACSTSWRSWACSDEVDEVATSEPAAGRRWDARPRSSTPASSSSLTGRRAVAFIGGSVIAVSFDAVVVFAAVEPVLGELVV